MSEFREEISPITRSHHHLFSRPDERCVPESADREHTDCLSCCWHARPSRPTKVSRRRAQVMSYWSKFTSGDLVEFRISAPPSKHLQAQTNAKPVFRTKLTAFGEDNRLTLLPHYRCYSVIMHIQRPIDKQINYLTLFNLYEKWRHKDVYKESLQVSLFTLPTVNSELIDSCKVGVAALMLHTYDR